MVVPTIYKEFCIGNIYRIFMKRKLIQETLRLLNLRRIFYVKMPLIRLFNQGQYLDCQVNTL